MSALTKEQMKEIVKGNNYRGTSKHFTINQISNEYKLLGNWGLFFYIFLQKNLLWEGFSIINREYSQVGLWGLSRFLYWNGCMLEVYRYVGMY